MDADLQAFKTKVRAGANSAITQYFFNVDAYKFFVDSCEKMGLDLPGLAMAERFYAEVQASGMGRKGTQVLLRLLEGLNGDTGEST